MIQKMVLAVPKNVVDRSQYPLKAIEKFEKVTGILKTRRYDGPIMELAIEAAKVCMEKMLDRRLRAVIYVTQSPSRSSPSMANDLVAALDLPKEVPVFDVNQSCTGFVYALWLAQCLLSNEYDEWAQVLIVCADQLRSKKRGATEDLIFSDGACAALVTWSYPAHVTTFHTDPSGIKHLYADRDGPLTMDGGEVFDFVTRNVPKLVQKHQIIEGDQDLLCQHQPNEAMMATIDLRTGFKGRSLRSIGEFGNMSMVSIPATLALNEKEILGKRILLCGYGAGWSVAIRGIHWGVKPVTHILEL